MNHTENRPGPSRLAAALALCLALAASAPSSAQDSSAAAFLDTLARAEAASAARRWKEAAALWEGVVRANPVEGRFWYQLATAHYNAKDYRKAIPAFERVLESGFGGAANAAYNIACNYALLGDKEQALRWLERAFAHKFPSLRHAQEDEDLRPLHDEPRFRELVGLIDTSRMSRDEGWRTDLRFLVREIKRRGYHLFPRVSTEAEFDAEVKKLHDSIPRLTDAQVAVGMMRLMRRVGDGHSGLLGSAERAEWLQTLPVLFYMFEEGLFVVAADPKHKDLLGAQVVKFGGRTVEEVVRAVDEATSRDNAIWIKQVAPYRMRHLPLLHAAGVVPDPQKVSLTLRGADGRERVVTLTTDATQPNIWNVKPHPAGWVGLAQTLAAPLPLYLKNPAAPYWFEYLPESRTVYFQFNSVRNDQREPLAAFSERLFKFVNESDVDRLVIDLRWNNGGNTFLLTPLLHGLIRNDKVNRRGRLFVITGRRTYSAAQNASTFFERHTQATFVGEPTGSSPNFVGEEDPFLLPYSKILANVSHLYWQSALPQDERTWIAPRLYAPPTFKAYSANRDPALEAILAYREPQN